MGYWNIKCDKCGQYLWDENPDLERCMDEEYSRGFDSGIEEGPRGHTLSKENEQLKSLLAANVRVIKEELRKELEEEKLEVNP